MTQGDYKTSQNLNARNLDDSRRMLLGLTARGGSCPVHQESPVFNGEDSPMANLLLSVMVAFAQFERER